MIIKVNCFFCDENVGYRRSIEIRSCIEIVEQFVPDERTKLLFYSDNCIRQNKNSTLTLCFVNNISEITNTFLTTGHVTLCIAE